MLIRCSCCDFERRVVAHTESLALLDEECPQCAAVDITRSDDCLHQHWIVLRTGHEENEYL